jgi:hypothetical protein
MAPLCSAITQVGYPVIEVHGTNPTARGTVSAVLPYVQGPRVRILSLLVLPVLEAVKHTTTH